MSRAASLEVSAYLTLYLVLKIGLNYYNKWLLSQPPTGLGFPATLFYTMCHMVASVAGSSILMLVVPRLGALSLDQFRRSMGKLSALSLLFCISIGGNNLSLPLLGLSVNQVIKATCVLFVLGFSYVLERKTYSRAKVGLIVLIVTGTCISVPWGTPNAQPAGILLCLASVVAIGAKTSVGSVLLRGAREEGLTPMVLVWYESFFSIFYLFVAALALREPRKLDAFAAARPENVGVSAGVVLGGSAMAFTYNFASFKFLALTSSVTHTICGNITLVAVVVVPAVFIDHITSPVSWAGFALFLAASAAYTYVSHVEASQAEPAAAATAPASEDAAPAQSGAGAVPGAGVGGGPDAGAARGAPAAPAGAAADRGGWWPLLGWGAGRGAPAAAAASEKTPLTQKRQR